MDIGIGMKMNQIARQQVGYGFTKGIITKGISNELKIGKKPLKNAPCNFEQFSKFGSIQPAPHICGAGFFVYAVCCCLSFQRTWLTAIVKSADLGVLDRTCFLYTSPISNSSKGTPKILHFSILIFRSASIQIHRV